MIPGGNLTLSHTSVVACMNSGTIMRTRKTFRMRMPDGNNADDVAPLTVFHSVLRIEISE